ncbi:uncharacterized protein [Penaeus vannamei]|uniref:uncharacterized protein n=1 Tax=Penaeus vannamei TaxID=6689 RepID=UPI00387F8E10
MSESLEMEAMKENITLCADGASGEGRENGADEETEDSDESSGAQSEGNDKTRRDKTCNREFWCLIFSFFSMTVDQVLDGISINTFNTGGHSVFFWLCLVFTAVPALFIHLYATKALKPSGWKALLCYPVAPWVLVGKTIHIHGKRNKTDEKKELQEVLTVLKVAEGFFEAVPQLFIQMTALRMGILTGDSGVILSYVKLGVSFITASSSLLAKFCKEMHWVFEGVSVFLVALVLGSRAFVCASLFSLPGPLLYTGFVPLVLSFLLALATDCVFNREKMSLNRAYIKATLLPPQDKAGVVASLVYCGLGLVFWLLTLSRPWSVLVFVGVTFIHFLGGIGWMILTKNGNKCCKGEEEP